MVVDGGFSRERGTEGKQRESRGEERRRLVVLRGRKATMVRGGKSRVWVGSGRGWFGGVDDEGGDGG